MGVRESLLNTITSVGNGDFVRIVTSAGASSKATVQNLFKSFESGLSAKSSLTTSDYIRVVGSDNVSYKQLVSDVAKKIIENYTGSSLAGSNQSVKSALDALNSKSLRYVRSITSADDCNVLTQGVYIYTTSAPQNAPSGTMYGTLIVIEGSYGASVFNFQLLSTSGRGLYYRRKQGNSSDVFAAWTKVTGTQV